MMFGKRANSFPVCRAVHPGKSRFCKRRKAFKQTQNPKETLALVCISYFTIMMHPEKQCIPSGVTSAEGVTLGRHCFFLSKVIDISTVP
ncbi:hypothetical protein P4H42_13140 [Paenibacillus macerans]|uniref:hypothetical protein n=1 Tax=Paenibacillus macerans TaxID=44252 RepID=UPI002DBD8030|nr:hypothetical protein [Paenibacillus macerans]MEC0330559.1 hypothetical protein [Paenibacillus macerans]